MPQSPPQVKISAYLFLGLCLLCACLACTFGIVWYGTAQEMEYSQNANPNAGIYMAILTLIYGGFMMACGIAGYALLRLASWARLAGIVLGVIALFIFPPWSTILGGVALVLLFQKEAKQAFLQ